VQLEGGPLVTADERPLTLLVGILIALALGALLVWVVSLLMG
jgi:hypothetical protein